MSAADCCGFKLLYSGSAEDLVKVTKWSCLQTGFQVYVADVEGPLVSGHVCLATETDNDDGLPHTLEHLIFMGSKNYPYKGVLDLLAGRCLAAGTNAHTHVDHTTYDLCTAGSEGFLNLLPICLDHIFYPLLDESAYITEVHHINGLGEDAGVVYCEMESCEKSLEDIADLKTRRLLYKGTGYSSYTGGAVVNLRESTSHAKVIGYHKAYYRMDNAALLVVGRVDAKDVLSTLEPFCRDYSQTTGQETMSGRCQAWQSSVPPFQEEFDRRVKYPCEEEESAGVFFSWRGPNVSGVKELCAVTCLLEYLSSTSISPLYQEFVEVEDAFASQVSYDVTDFRETQISIEFQDVPLDKTEQIKPKFVELLEKICNEASIDMERMHSVIDKETLGELQRFEHSPHGHCLSVCALDFLYGPMDTELSECLFSAKIYKELLIKDISFWIDLLQRYFLGSKHVHLIATPSVDLKQELAEREKDRLTKQKKALGENGLKLCDAKLKAAVSKNEEPIPEGLVSTVDIPDPGKIQFHTLKTANTYSPESAAMFTDFPLCDLHVRFQLDSVRSNFVQIIFAIDTSDLDHELRKYLQLYANLMLECPVERNGKIIRYEDAVAELEKELVEYSSEIGFQSSSFSPGFMSQVFSITFVAEVAKYPRAILLLKDFLYGVIFTKERLEITAAQMLKEIGGLKREEEDCLREIRVSKTFTNHSNCHAAGMLRQQTLLKKVLADPQSAIECLNRLKWVLTQTHRLCIHVCTDVVKLATASPKPEEPWKAFGGDSIVKSRIIPQFAHECIAGSASQACCVYAVGESSYVQLYTGGIGFGDEQTAALGLCIELLTADEGPLWTSLRGNGLSYGYYIRNDPEERLIVFEIGPSSRPVEAFEESCRIISQYMGGKRVFSELELQGAKSREIYRLISRVSTVERRSRDSMYNYYKGRDTNFVKQQIKKVQNLSLPDVMAVGRKYLSDFFNPSKASCFVTCSTNKRSDLVEVLKHAKFNVSVVTSLNESFLTQF